MQMSFSILQAVYVLWVPLSRDERFVLSCFNRWERPQTLFVAKLFSNTNDQQSQTYTQAELDAPAVGLHDDCVIMLPLISALGKHPQPH